MSSAASSQDSLHRHHHQQQQLAVIQGYGGYYALPHGVGVGGHSLPPGVVPSPVIAGSNAAAHAAAVAAAKNKNKGMKSTLGRYVKVAAFECNLYFFFAAFNCNSMMHPR